MTMLALLCACSDEPELSTLKHQDALDSTFAISESDALQCVLSHMDNVQKTVRDKRRHMPSRSKRESAAKCKSYPGYYVFNFQDDNGFAIASADRRDGVGVYLSSLEGSITEEEWNDSENGLGLLKEMVENHHRKMISSEQSKSLKPSTPRRDPVGDMQLVMIDDTLYSYGPLLQTRWHQNAPYNNYNPDSIVMGCGPVALGQIMAYYETPNTVTVNGITYNFDWDLIYDARNPLSGSDASYVEVYKLLHAIGICGHAIYGTQTTMADIYIAPTLSVFGYSVQNPANFYCPTVINEVSVNRPVIMEGWNASHTVGHYWVVDGAMHVTHFEGFYDPDTGQYLQNTILEEFMFTDYYTYLWVNWGYRYQTQEKRLYSYLRDSDLYNIPLQVNASVFDLYTSNLIMWTGITPL